jgi:hypothetical protein
MAHLISIELLFSAVRENEHLTKAEANLRNKLRRIERQDGNGDIKK